MNQPRPAAAFPLAVIIIILVIGVPGVYLVARAFTERDEAAAFSARAVTVEANVISATETTRRRNPTFTEAQISFTTPGGSIGPTFAEVTDCPESRIPVEAESVEVLYDPNDVTDVRVPGCQDKNFKLFLALGGVLIALDVLFIIGRFTGRRRAALMAAGPEAVDVGRAEPIVVKQKQSSVFFLYGFLSVGFAAALIRGHMGAETGTGRLVIDAIFGVLLIGTIALGIHLARNPVSVAVARDVISFSHRGGKNPIELRRTGDLYISRQTILTGSTAARVASHLRVGGSDAAIPLDVLDQEELVRACLSMGWRFADPQ